MSVESLCHVWNVKGVTPEEKLLLIFIANASGDLGYPFSFEPCSMGEFISGDLYDGLRVLGQLKDKGLVQWNPEDEETSGYIWLTYDGDYMVPPSFVVETKSRSKRVLALLDRDGPGCAYCDAMPATYHVDHVIPRSRGGPDVLDNLVLACGPCNTAKGAKTPGEWGRKMPSMTALAIDEGRLVIK